MGNINADKASGPSPKPYAGMKAVLVSTVTVETKQAQDDTVTFGVLPQGAILLGGKLFAGDVEAGSTYELDIGTSADPDKYLDSGAIAAGALNLDELDTLIQGSGPTELSAEETVIGTVIEAATGAGLGELTLVLEYTSA